VSNSEQTEDRVAGKRLVSDAEYAILASFRASLRRFASFSEEAAAGVGLRPQQHQALLAIRALGGRSGPTIGELAEHLLIRHHSAVGLVDRLVRMGLVVRRTSESDRRQVHVLLTTHGADILEELTAAHRRELQRIGPELRDLLERITADAARGSHRG
jgi:DNA-binding MarR family transcriptional regulator